MLTGLYQQVPFFGTQPWPKCASISQVCYRDLHLFFPSQNDKILQENCFKTWARRKMWTLCPVALFLCYGETEHPRSELSLQFNTLAPVLPVLQITVILSSCCFVSDTNFQKIWKQEGLSQILSEVHIFNRGILFTETVYHSRVLNSISCKAHLWVHRRACNLRHTDGSGALQTSASNSCWSKFVNLQIIIHTAKAGHVLTWTWGHFSHPNTPTNVILFLL